MINFNKALKKGDYAEQIVAKYYEKRGYVIYRPVTKDRAHYFDMLCSLDKKKVIALDVKAKARLNCWAAQGINKTHYEQYMNFAKKCNIPFYLIFVDEINKTVHRAELKKLKKPIRVNNFIIAWKLAQMKLLFRISDKQAAKLQKLSQRNYTYEEI